MSRQLATGSDCARSSTHSSPERRRDHFRGPARTSVRRGEYNSGTPRVRGFRGNVGAKREENAVVAWRPDSASGPRAKLCVPNAAGDACLRILESNPRLGHVSHETHLPAEKAQA